MIKCIFISIRKEEVKDCTALHNTSREKSNFAIIWLFVFVRRKSVLRIPNEEINVNHGLCTKQHHHHKTTTTHLLMKDSYDSSLDEAKREEGERNCDPRDTTEWWWGDEDVASLRITKQSKQRTTGQTAVETLLEKIILPRNDSSVIKRMMEVMKMTSSNDYRTWYRVNHGRVTWDAVFPWNEVENTRRSAEDDQEATDARSWHRQFITMMSG